jgi:DNA mismatch repair protein MutL
MIYLKEFRRLPTAHLSKNKEQFFFVKGSPVKNKMLPSIVRVAYADVVPPWRFPGVVLFLEITLNKVDVNVHPTKIEIGFAEVSFVKEFVLYDMKRG